MRPLGAALIFASAIVCFAGCGSRSKEAVDKSLPPGTLAEVGTERVSAATVERIVAAQAVAPRAALERAVGDALFAREAEAQLSPGTQRTLLRAARARAVLQGFADRASEGPPTDEEIRSIVAERWTELDRPESVRVTHAVALAKPGDPKRSDARRLAEAIRRAVQSLRDPEEFMRAARAVPTSGIQVVAERLPFIAADGRGMSAEPPHGPEGGFDEAFAKAANALTEPGAVSGVVESSFGYHVLLLEERLSARKVPFEDLRRALSAEALSRRAGNLRKELLDRLRRETRIEVARDVELATQKLVQ